MLNLNSNSNTAVTAIATVKLYFYFLVAVILFLQQGTMSFSLYAVSDNHRSEIYGVKNSGWKSPLWRWGSAVGTGHDCAKICRTNYEQQSARQELVDTLISSNANKMNFEEVKLVLALTFQRGRWDGCDGGAGGYGEVMQWMAEANRYEDDNTGMGGSVRLIHDMQQRFHLLQPSNEEHTTQMNDMLADDANSTLRDNCDQIDVMRRQCSGFVLSAMGFVENGC